MVTAQRPMILYGPDGQPLRRRSSYRQSLAAEFTQQVIRARYDAAQTTTYNENHWANADRLDPHSANSLSVRRTLRSRSRYEVIENNPFLKGLILTIANDFVGSGPKLQITDERIPVEVRKVIQQKWAQWMKLAKLRRKLWRMRVAKITDGETFLRAYSNGRLRDPVKLDFQVLEADMISSQDTTAGIRREGPTPYEIDGVRFDKWENPLAYHVLNYHPGGSAYWTANLIGGNWIDANNIIHWFRQDRGWLRGIPETTPSLPLCSILRRYTLAVLHHKEFAADFTGILETEGPASVAQWTDGQGNLVDDDPFDTFPIDKGLFTRLPWGYKMKQMEAVPDGVAYDEFVGSILREITRPLLATFNIAAGTSKDSNMASGILDQHLYKGGQESERFDAEDEVLDPIFSLWWNEALLVPGYFTPGMRSLISRVDPPIHTWRWDPVGIEHTDPAKVAQALQILHDKGFLLDRDIQEGRFNRSLEEWRDAYEEQMEWREEVEPTPEPPALPGQEAPGDAEEPEDSEGSED